MNLKARFKPRAERGLLSQLIQEAWQDYSDRVASKERQAEVAERIARYFEGLIPAPDFEVLQRYNCIVWEDRANVRVYDADTEEDAMYRAAFGVELPRKVPVLGKGGYGYPSIVACEPTEMRGEPEGAAEERARHPLRDLDPYFLALLTARKQYQREYKASMEWPAEYAAGEGAGRYPTWGDIAERWPVLGERLRKKAAELEPAA